MPWNESIGAALALMRRANAISTETGDLVFRLYTIVHIPALSLAAGAPLDDIHRELEVSLAAARKSGFELIVMCLIGLLRLVESLRGVSPGTVVDETPYLNPTGGLHVAACFYWIRQAQARVHEGDFAGAVRAIDRADPLMWTTPSFFERAEFVFYGALARAGMETVQASPRFHAQLVEWAAVGPDTFTARAALVGAELARLERSRRRRRARIRAPRSTRRGCRGSCTRKRSPTRSRRDSTRRAVCGRARKRSARTRARVTSGGAHLARSASSIAATAACRHPARAAGRSRQLDVATVLEISHAVSSEIVHERLVERLMAIAVEHAGAARGLLITPIARWTRDRGRGACGANAAVAVNVVRTPVDGARSPRRSCTT